MPGLYDSIERKRAIFISSPFRDLILHRKALIDGTLTAGQFPIAMEFFVGNVRPTLAHIEQNIRSSDIFVIMLGNQLGSNSSTKQDMYYIMQELSIAEQCNLPIIPVLLSEDEHKKKTEDYKRSNKYDMKIENNLKELRERLRKTANGEDRLALFFSYDKTTLNSLRDQFALRLIHAVNALPNSGGWVPGSYVTDAIDRLARLENTNKLLNDELAKRAALKGGVGENVFFREFVDRMNEFSMLSGRVNLRDNLKRGIADYFWKQYLTPIIQSDRYHIYFESGSSIAFVCRQFIERLSEREAIADTKFSKNVHLYTNNFIALLDLLLTHPRWRWHDVHVYPFGDFFDKYGATYGQILRSVIEQNPPGLEMMHPDFSTLGPDAPNAVDKVARELAVHFNSKAVILMTASGIDIRRIMTRDDPAYTIDSDFTPFPGPHTGSYYNMLIKRALLQQSCPKVLFLDDYKWGLNFIVDNCFAVCDLNFQWSDLIEKTPLAIALATDSREKRDLIRDKLRDIGFNNTRLGTPQDKKVVAGEIPAWSVIAANKLFHEQLPVSGRK